MTSPYQMVTYSYVKDGGRRQYVTEVVRQLNRGPVDDDKKRIHRINHRIVDEDVYKRVLKIVDPEGYKLQFD